MRAGIGAALLLVASAVPAVAAAPPELLNKTVQVRYTVTMPGRGDDGSTVPGVRNTTRTIYISSAGRLFARRDRTDGGRAQNSDRKDGGPGEMIASTLRLQGRRLVGNAPFISGAAHMEIDFDSSASSCTASLMMGRDSGRAIRWKGVNGVSYTQTAPPTIRMSRARSRQAIPSHSSGQVRPLPAFAGSSARTRQRAPRSPCTS